MRRYRRRGEGGVALLGAIIVVAIVTGLTLTIGQRLHFDIAITARILDARAAEAAFRALEGEAREVLAQDLETSHSDHKQEPWATETIVHTDTRASGAAQIKDVQGLFNLNNLVVGFATQTKAEDSGTAAVDGEAGTDVRDTQDDKSEADAAQVLVEVSGDNRQQATPPTQWEVAIARFTLLLSALEIDNAVIPAILDWLDADSEARFPGGAEDAYYMALDEPYRAANRAFVDVTELRLIRGITPEIYARLAPFVCTLPRASAINVNLAPPEVLMALAPGIDRGTAEMLDAGRTAQPFQSVADFVATPMLAGRPLLSSGLSTASSWFIVQMHADAGASVYSARTLLARASLDQIEVVSRTQGYFDD